MPAKEHILYGGDHVLVFDPGPHVYRHKATGRKITSTTTITENIHKPALVPWAVSETIKHLHLCWKPDQPYSTIAKDAMLQSCKKRHRDISREALDVGTTVHRWIDSFAKATIAYDPNTVHIPFPENVEARLACAAFLQWYSEHDVVILSSEQKVYSPSFDYAGTFDWKALVDGKLVMIDFKSSKGIWPDYFVQLAAYVQAEEEEQAYLAERGLKEEVERFEKGIIVRVPKDGSEFEIQETVLLDDLFEAFKACLTLQHWKSGTLGTIFDKNRVAVLEKRQVRPRTVLENMIQYGNKYVAYKKGVTDDTFQHAISKYGLSFDEQHDIQRKYIPRKYSVGKLAEEYSLTQHKIKKILDRDLAQVHHNVTNHVPVK